MATNQSSKPMPRKKSKRERRVKFIVYIMIIAMLLSSLTAGLVMFL
ncbi:stressosome-associated protein Prli42 [Ornithinibacillus salinisoli]|uniref:Stressosome-associated protein Prli42 n=1 Tax=Ornithinibacillus salinisoli TaxID=1848459 RepID=A0ABW4W5V1_9BACI